MDEYSGQSGQEEHAEIDEDTRVLGAALESFRSYRRTAHYQITHTRRQSFYALPSEHWTLLAGPPFSVLDTLSAVDDAIDTNAVIAERIYQIGLASFCHANRSNEDSHNYDGHDADVPANNSMSWEKDDAANAPDTGDEREYSMLSLPKWVKASSNDVDKARSTIRQLFRDWSAEGTREREATYRPVLEALEREFPAIDTNTSVVADEKASVEDSTSESISIDRGHVRVLVPGAGLGRLVFEICRAGFAVEGNEISYHQLLTSSFILNHTTSAQRYALHPWSLSFSNILSRKDQLQKVMIPDVHPGEALNAASEGCAVHAFDRMSMTAADFCIVYKDSEYRDRFNAVTTVFFIDTAPNLITYVETIRNCLKSNGLWINAGPLLWHFGNKNDEGQSQGGDSNGKNDNKLNRGLPNDRSNPSTTTAKTSIDPPENLGIGEPGSVELSEDEVLEIVRHYGFVIERHNYLRTGYIQNQKSMLQHEYVPSFWIARKVDRK